MDTYTIDEIIAVAEFEAEQDELTVITETETLTGKAYREEVEAALELIEDQAEKLII